MAAGRASDGTDAQLTGVDLDDSSELTALRSVLERLGRVVVAFSGGADSALLAYVATETLGAARALCVTAVSPSLAPEEYADCAALAREWGLRWTAIGTDELAKAAYAANDRDRCYHCKTELMTALVPMARAESASVVLGVNLDDLDDIRPGQRAALEHGAVFPLVEVACSKARVRALSATLGLRTADKPAAACLASRVPHGTPVTVRVLDRVARAESALRRLGIRQLRVRHYGDCARLEFDLEEIAHLLDRREEIVAAVRGAGYRYVTVDLEGFQSGNLARDAARR